MEKIILISGKAGAGKDTAAQMMKEYLETKGKRVAVTHYAKHMKDMLYEFYNWDGIKDAWARNKLQWLGTEKIRIAMNMPEFHVKRTSENMDIIQEDFDYFIVADCRFPNELEYVGNYFGKDSTVTIRVNRINYKSTLSPEAQNHPSEISLDSWEDWDYEIISMNNDLDGLRAQCELIVDKILA